MAKTVLIVEDESEVAELLREVLAEAGFDVVLSTGGAALATAADVHPDVVVIDYAMPGMTGADVISEMRQSAEPTMPPVVLVTGHYEASEIAREIGANAYLQKPFDVDDLVGVVRRLTESS